MPVVGTSISNRIGSLVKTIRRGGGTWEKELGQGDYGYFDIVTDGGTTISDVAYNTSVTLLADSDVPSDCYVYVTGATFYVNGATAWSGGTTTNVSLSLQDNAGTDIATMTGASLGTAKKIIVMPLNADAIGTAASGITNIAVGTGTKVAAIGRGLKVVGASNSTAGSNVRVRVWGYFGKS